MLETLRSYSIIDFMPMGPDVYGRLFERANTILWPWHILIVAFTAAIILLAWRKQNLWALRSCALLWCWVGGFFHLYLFRELNWAAMYFGLGFIAQGMLMFIASFVDSDYQTSYRKKTIALFAASCCMVLSPFLSLILPDKTFGVELVGLSPDATALFCIVITTLTSRFWPWLSIIPVLWLLLSALISSSLHVQNGILFLAASVIYVGLMFVLWVWSKRQVGKHT